MCRRGLSTRVAHAGHENLDERHVARYDAKMDADAEREVRALKELGLAGESQVVEFGAGTGQFTVCVAAACAHVTAIDVLPVMLRRLRTNVDELGLVNVTVVRAGFLSYRHEGPPVDFVYSRLALHHLPDFWKAVALSRVRGMLRRGGVLRLWDVVYDFEPSETVGRIEAWCETAGSDADVETDWTRAELEEHVRDEHSTFSWLLEAMIERARFAIVSAEHAADAMDAKYLLRAI
jgi:ubiquinone/menaquinone biosynthesis C-methylase UbiE